LVISYGQNIQMLVSVVTLREPKMLRGLPYASHVVAKTGCGTGPGHACVRARPPHGELDRDRKADGHQSPTLARATAEMSHEGISRQQKMTYNWKVGQLGQLSASKA
jgi:hypothetical protein